MCPAGLTFALSSVTGASECGQVARVSKTKPVQGKYHPPPALSISLRVTVFRFAVTSCRKPFPNLENAGRERYFTGHQRVVFCVELEHRAVRARIRVSLKVLNNVVRD